jgi:nicotinate phosphoribosyltransferase
MTRERLPSAVFDLPIHEMRRGYRSDIYFWREKIVLENENHHPHVLMQVFQKQEAILCGIDEAIAILRVAAGRYRDRDKAYTVFDKLMEVKQEIRASYGESEDINLRLTQKKLQFQRELDALWAGAFDELEVKALSDGDAIRPIETVMTIEGDASHFAHLETLYLGVLARRTRIATNVNKVAAAARGKPVLYFPARFDHWSTQGGDGYAAHIGGAAAVSTDAQAEWWGAKAVGTIPHALIACYGGDTVRATERFAAHYPNIDVIALVDFDNDCVETSLATARALGRRLWGVRLDTAETMVDRSIQGMMERFRPTGVCAELVVNAREALDREGFDWVKIIVSGGFDPERIAAFEARGVPVDAYGVGSSLMRGAYDFTADIVMVEGAPCAKKGRTYHPNPRLELVEKQERRT